MHGEYPESERIDVNRTTVSGTQFRNITSGHKVQQWKKSIADPSNKTALTSFLSTEWQQDNYRTKLGDKILFVTSEEQCSRITADKVEKAEELKSTQEEADTRLLFHADHAARAGYESVIIASEDTDVFVLCLAFNAAIPCSMYQKCGTQTGTRYVDIRKVAHALGESFCKSLPGLHAFV